MPDYTSIPREFADFFEKRTLATPDPIYKSRLVSMLTVRLLKEGKPFNSDYTLVLDSDVLFPSNIIEQYLCVDL